MCLCSSCSNGQQQHQPDETSNMHSEHFSSKLYTDSTQCFVWYWLNLVNFSHQFSIVVVRKNIGKTSILHSVIFFDSACVSLMRCARFKRWPRRFQAMRYLNDFSDIIPVFFRLLLLFAALFSFTFTLRNDTPLLYGPGFFFSLLIVNLFSLIILSIIHRDQLSTV